jgi:hypothetical protein
VKPIREERSVNMPRYCSVCGCVDFVRNDVLWLSLIDEWQLSPIEVDYVNRQQGEKCASCGANLRSIALASALRTFLKCEGTLSDWIGVNEKSYSLLEINEAGTLTPILRQFPSYTYAAYPEVDMHCLPYSEGMFDIVIHSDTLSAHR